MKTQKHKGVYFFFFKRQDATLREGKQKQKQTKKKQKKTQKKKNGTVKRDEQEGGLRRPTGWYEVWRSMQKSTRKRELLQKCHHWASGWTPARLKRHKELAASLSRQNKRSLWKRYHPVWGTALVERVTFASAWISWVVHFILFHTCTHSQFRDAQFVFSKFEATRGRRRLDLRRGIHRELHRVKNAPTVTGVKLKVSPGFQ